MGKTLQERIAENKRSEARAAFAGYVQSVAFNMTLSRNMVDMLGLVRDSNFAGNASYSDILHGSGSTYRPKVQSMSVPLFKSLERRGLVLHNHWDGGPERKAAPKGFRYHELTRAGELMCDLLVEAGLLAGINQRTEKTKANR